MLKTIQNLFRKIVKSKITVVFAILAVWISGLQTETSAEYSASIAYQQYLLGSESDEVQEDSEDEKAAMKMGSLGSGGVSGEFAYDEIVNSAGEDKEDEARQFASTMATYSTFNFFSNKVEGFSSIMPYVGRFLSLLLLLPLAVLMDLLHLIIPTLIKLIAKLNVIRMLAEFLTDLDITSELSDMIGISKEDISNVTTILLSASIIMILLALAGMFRTKRVDQRSYGKLKGRLFSIIALPLIVGIGAQFLDDLVSFTSDNDKASGNFSRYMVDDRAWAYNFNFAPNGEDGEDGDIDPSNDNSYVDLKYNPYTGTGKDRIKQINSKSSLAKSGGDGNIFPNTSMALSYGTSASFSSVDFINYKGTKASQSFYGRDDGDGEAFGSYYQYAEDNKDELIDVDKSYQPSGGEEINRKNGKEEPDKESQKGGYKEAIDDYKDGDDLIESPQIAWRDRFIYGAKNAGENLDDYYGEKPSKEQMENQVGQGNAEAFSDQSMFLILSTMFNETGGKYYIDAPARGVMQAKAAFDSNRSTYYVVSMVGNPFFTIFGLISKPIIQLVIMMAVITAILSLGVIEMNTKPIMAWLKGMTLGDIEYAQALIMYAVGIAGTIVALIVLPEMLGDVMEGIGKLIVLPGYFMDRDALSPQASLALHGTPLIFSSMVSLFFGYLYLKSESFRTKLIELFTMPWSWAKSAGERIETQVSGGAGLRAKQENARTASRSRFNQSLTPQQGQSGQDNSRLGSMKNWMKGAKEGIKTDLNIPDLSKFNPQKGQGQDKPDQGLGSLDQSHLRSPSTVERNGMYERAMNGLKANESDNGVSSRAQVASIDAQDGIMKFHNKPSQETYSGARDKLDILDDEMTGGSEDQRYRVDGAKRELHSLAKSHNIIGGEGDSDTTSGEDNATENRGKPFQGDAADQLENEPTSDHPKRVGPKKGDKADQLENDAITSVTGIEGGKLKDLEAIHNDTVGTDPISKNIRERVGTDWENKGYGFSDSEDFEEIEEDESDQQS